MEADFCNATDLSGIEMKWSMRVDDEVQLSDKKDYADSFRLPPI